MTMVAQNPPQGLLHCQIPTLLRGLSGIRCLLELDVATLSQRTLLTRAAHIVLDHADIFRCSIFLHDSRMLTCAVDADQWPRSDVRRRIRRNNRLHFAMGEGIIGSTALNARTCYLQESDIDDDYRSPSLGRIVSARHTCDGGRAKPKTMGAVICAPLLANRMLLGVLAVSHPVARFFQPWQEYMIVMTADTLGSVLHYQQLLQGNNGRCRTTARSRKKRVLIKTDPGDLGCL